MADYAALLNAEKKKTSPSPTKEVQQVQMSANPQMGNRTSPQGVKPANPQAVIPTSPQDDMSASMQTHLTASPQVDKAASRFATKSVLEKAERYTTRLQPSLVKRIKIYAAEHDITDYEVVKQAVEEYFAKKR